MQKSRTVQFLAVFGIGLGLIVLGMIWSIVNIALASIQKELSGTIHQLQSIITCFGIFMCAPFLAMGKLGDVYGRKPFYLAGLIIALVFSIIAGFANELWILIVCMGFFGFAGSMIVPLSQALLVHQFPERQKDKAVGIWSMFVSVSLATGPFIGGVILHFLGWRWIYWINIPFAILAIGLVLPFVEKEKIKEHTKSDWRSIALLALFIFTFILPIMQGPIWGWASIPTALFFAISLFSLSAFIVIERSSKHAIFRADLFANPAFLFSAIPNSCAIGFLWVIFFIIPLYLQNILQLSAFQTGSIFLLITMPVFLFSKIVSLMAKKWGYRLFMLAGFITFGCVFLLQTKELPTLWAVLLSCLFFGIGWVLTWGTSISSALSSIPHHLAGTAAGMFNTLQELGAVTSLALAGVFFHMVQNSKLQPHLTEIHAAFAHMPQEKFSSLISNPGDAAIELGQQSEIVNWLVDAFVKGYQSIFWFLFFVSIFAFAITFFIPKSSSKHALH